MAVSNTPGAITSLQMELPRESVLESEHSMVAECYRYLCKQNKVSCGCNDTFCASTDLLVFFFKFKWTGNLANSSGLWMHGFVTAALVVPTMCTRILICHKPTTNMPTTN